MCILTTAGTSDEDDEVGPDDLSYRPLNLGSVRSVLPAFLQRQFFLEVRAQNHWEGWCVGGGGVCVWR